MTLTRLRGYALHHKKRGVFFGRTERRHVFQMSDTPFLFRSSSGAKTARAQSTFPLECERADIDVVRVTVMAPVERVE